MLKLICIASGGAIGAIARFSISGCLQNGTPGTFPWGTLCVNTVGSLLIGLFLGLSELVPVSPTVKLFVAVGFLGAFTTFSTYSVETLNLLRDRQTFLGLMNIGLNNLLALACVFGGYFLSRYAITLAK
jgi:CrcB protein